MDYIKIGGITFGILFILVIIYYYNKKLNINKDDKYIAIDDQKYGKTIPNYKSLV